MRYTKRKSGREHTSSMDMSSLMDIIFILLIFVMMSVSFAKNFKQIEIDLPKSETGSSEFSPDIQISVREDDKFYLEQKEISIGELSQFAANGKFSNQIVSVNVSKKVPYESFIKSIGYIKTG
ncbi:MAG: biopolymer transporter ExbD [Leptospiraceae bacterium]|nr:biopolymer transporter ExbD [Leptospiraceae bacterium]